MSGLIPQNFIDTLLARSDIAEVIGLRVELKRAGSQLKACCPFHGEKTPSFFVTPQKQFYHCFGCGVSGNVISFLMQHDHLSFVEAAESLAETLGLDVPREQSDNPVKPPSKTRYDRMAACQQLFNQERIRSAQATEYLARRDISVQMIERFGIGYAPDSYQNLDSMVKNNTEAKNDLIATGMLIDGERNSYPRFRGRIMVPIRDGRGRYIGFGGRILDQGEPKYLNSPETELFSKGKELFGLYEARQFNRKLNSLFVVEGYMDAIALHQFGISNVVATLGTATTTDQLRLLFKQVNNVVFCFDGDRAGREAAWKALINALPLLEDGRDLRFCFLPDGDDPDSFVRDCGSLGFEQFAASALTLEAFFIEHIQADAGQGGIAARAKMASIANPLIAQIPDGVFKTLLNQTLNEKLGIDQNQVHQPQRRSANRNTQSKQTSPGFANIGRGPGKVSLLIGILLRHPSIGLAQARLDSQINGAELYNLVLATIAAHPDARREDILAEFMNRDEFQILQRIEVKAKPRILDDLEAALLDFKDTYQRVIDEFQRNQFPRAMLSKKTSELSPSEKADLLAKYKK